MPWLAHPAYTTDTSVASVRHSISRYSSRSVEARVCEPLGVTLKGTAPGRSSPASAEYDRRTAINMDSAVEITGL